MPAGRPAKWKKIDQEQLERCAEKHWTPAEIAAFFRVSQQTIDRHFGNLIKECRERGKSKLRDIQWRRALEGSDRILIHMSKHYLDQSEKVELSVSKEQAIKVLENEFNNGGIQDPPVSQETIAPPDKSYSPF